MSVNTMQATPLNIQPDDANAVAPLPPPTKKRRVNQRPKLTVQQLSSTDAIAALSAVGRATAEQFKPPTPNSDADNRGNDGNNGETDGDNVQQREGNHPANGTRPVGRYSHVTMLSAVVRRAARWAQGVAPHHSLSEFVVDARALSSNRTLRSHISNVRLAQLRGADVEAGSAGVEGNETIGATVAARGTDGEDAANGDAHMQNGEDGSGSTGGVAAVGGGVAADVPDDVDFDDGWEEPEDELFSTLENGVPGNVAGASAEGGKPVQEVLSGEKPGEGKGDIDGLDDADDGFFAALEARIEHSKLPPGNENAREGVGETALNVRPGAVKTSRKRRIVEDDDDDDDDNGNVDDGDKNVADKVAGKENLDDNSNEPVDTPTEAKNASQCTSNRDEGDDGKTNSADDSTSKAITSKE